MAYRYSPSTGCFYPNALTYAALPADVIPVTEAQYAAAMARGPRDTLAVSQGAVAVVPYGGPSLAEVQAAQITVLNQAYQAAITAPVNFTTAAGTRATFPQDVASKSNLSQCLAAGASAWTLNLWLNAAGQPVSPFTYADLQGLAAAMEAADAPKFQELLTLIAEVNAAPNADAARAVTWPTGA